MSYALPRTRTQFDGPENIHGNCYWPHHRPHTQNESSVPSTMSSLFESKGDLPMYKDKPYSYASSRRKRPIYLRKRVWILVGSILTFVFLWQSTLFSLSTRKETDRRLDENLWSWMKTQAKDKVDWNFRRESVKEAFKLSWAGYEQYAWGMWHLW